MMSVPRPGTPEAARDRAVAQAEANADEAWKELAYVAVLKLAATGIPFSASDVWQTGLPHPRQPKALGPILARAMRDKRIVPTGQWVKGQRVSRHAAPEREWVGVTE